MSDFNWGGLWSDEDNARALEHHGWMLGLIAKPHGKYEACLTGHASVNKDAREWQRKKNRFTKNVVKGEELHVRAHNMICASQLNQDLCHPITTQTLVMWKQEDGVLTPFSQVDK